MLRSNVGPRSIRVAFEDTIVIGISSGTWILLASSQIRIGWDADDRGYMHTAEKIELAVLSIHASSIDAAPPTIQRHLASAGPLEMQSWSGTTRTEILKEVDHQ